MFEEFYQKYETEAHEVIALICKCIGAGYHKSDNGDFWDMTVIEPFPQKRTQNKRKKLNKM